MFRAALTPRGNRRWTMRQLSSDDVWRLQCICKGCAQDIMAAGALCPMCRTRIQQTIIARF